PMGPFALMDFIGMEVNLAISKSIYEALGSPERFKPHWLQERLVAMGFKGKKSAAGFYLYNNGLKAGENPAAQSLLPRHPKAIPADEIFKRVMESIRAEASLMVSEGVASSSDIDKAVELGVRFPRGPFAWGLSAEKA
ncbi:MAG: hypothetical protein KGL53_06780, partial [Elusimicrobia bacterium]|nr:hypothetical protein [Elusimicrobiota bacterium]